MKNDLGYYSIFQYLQLNNKIHEVELELIRLK